MAAKKELPKNIINPFSDSFLDTWQIWKDFRWQEHKFKYKGVISEQAALMRLTTVAGGIEAVAVEIVMQSVANGWKDFYMIKQNGNGQGKSNTENRKDVADILGGRNYETGKH